MKSEILSVLGGLGAYLGVMALVACCIGSYRVLHWFNSLLW